MSELPSYSEMAAEKLKERSKASGGELRNLVSYSYGNPETQGRPFWNLLLFRLQNDPRGNCCSPRTPIYRYKPCLLISHSQKNRASPCNLNKTVEL